jgi:hypothetical protein
MRVILRIVAVVVMFLALTEAVLAVLELLQRPATGQQEALNASPPPPREKWTRILQRYCWDLHGPAALFCYGGILFVLIRISVIQEEEGAPPPAEPAPSGKRASP